MSKAPVIRRPGSDDLNFNHKRLYQLVRRAGHLSRADLTRQSGLTFPSVSRIAAELIAAGMLREGTTRRGGMGKPPVELAVNPEHSYGFGVHLDGGTATGSFVNVCGEPLGEISFPATSLTEGIDSALAESGLDPKKLVGVGLATLGEVTAEGDQERLSKHLGVPVFAMPAVAASVRAERYFGSVSELARFIYLDAQSLEIGAVVNGTVLAQHGTLTRLLGTRLDKSLAKKDVLPDAIRGAASLMQAEALVVSGLSTEDLESLSRSIDDLPVVAAAAQASDPALAAASMPLDETFGV